MNTLEQVGTLVSRCKESACTFFHLNASLSSVWHHVPHNFILFTKYCFQKATKKEDEWIGSILSYLCRVMK